MYLKMSLVALFIVSTSIACKQKGVTRMDPQTQTDLSGRWNDTDSRLVSEAMIGECLNHKWLELWNRAHNTEKDPRPAVIVGLILNKTHEHIETETFIKDMERAFINNGSVRVVAGDVFRQKVREERADQQDFSSLDTKKDFGLELGADFMLNGVMTSIIDQAGKEKVVYYQINLELTNMETNEKVWIGEKKIKKGIVK